MEHLFLLEKFLGFLLYYYYSILLLFCISYSVISHIVFRCVFIFHVSFLALNGCFQFEGTCLSSGLIIFLELFFRILLFFFYLSETPLLDIGPPALILGISCLCSHFLWVLSFLFGEFPLTPYFVPPFWYLLSHI